MISVLVVDDSVVIRRLITDALGEDPEIRVVGTAPNGRVALTKIDQLRPDLVTLDIEMPVMNGLETLRAIRSRLPAPAGHHVQHAHGGRRDGHLGRAVGRGQRLRDQAGQRRQHRREHPQCPGADHPAHPGVVRPPRPHRAAPAARSAARPAALETPTPDRDSRAVAGCSRPERYRGPAANRPGRTPGRRDRHRLLDRRAGRAVPRGDGVPGRPPRAGPRRAAHAAGVHQDVRRPAGPHHVRLGRRGRQRRTGPAGHRLHRTRGLPPGGHAARHRGHHARSTAVRRRTSAAPPSTCCSARSPRPTALPRSPSC